MLARRCQSASEAILLVLACLAPWAFGAVEAWAEMVLFAGIAAAGLLNVIAGWGSDRRRSLSCVPGLALLGLAALAAAQAAPLPGGALRWLSPATATLRAGLLPRTAESVSGDTGPVVPLPSATISQDREASIRTAARLAAGWILFQCALGLAPGPAPLRRLGLALAGNATLLAMFSLVQMLSWNGKIYWSRPSVAGNAGPFVCHNHLAAYLNLGLGFALAFLLMPRREGRRREGRGSRVWAAYATGLVLVGIVASLSRSGFLAMAASMVIGIVALRPRAQRLGLALGGLLLLVPVFLLALGTSASYQQRLSSIAESDAYSVRLQIWQRAIRIWPIYPALGTGLGSFPTASVRFFLNDGDESFAHAENEYLEWLVEGGVVGFGLILLGLAGTARLTRRALKATDDPRDRALILGAVYAILTLVIQSLGDFALHIPAVAIVAVLIAGQLAKRGLEATRMEPVEALGGAAGVVSTLGGLAAACLGLCLLAPAYRQMFAESALALSGGSLPGVQKVANDDGTSDIPQLEQKRAELERALRLRPDWADGHFRLGLIFLRLYELNSRELLREDFQDPEERAVRATPLALFHLVHASPDGSLMPTAELLECDPIRLDLVPAARQFLEARRCCYVLAQPHARLGTLDYLLEHGDGASRYLERALWLSGADRQLIETAQGMALQVRDVDLMVRCWRKALRLEGADWGPIAEMAKDLLDPQEILDRVVPSGRYTLLFAERLYSAPEERPIRDRFLREAIRRLPHDRGLSAAERLRLEGGAWLLLDDRDRAGRCMTQALTLEPRNAEYRKELVDWLIGWGKFREAHDQALIGLYFTPEHPDARAALDRAAEALAKGTGPATPGSKGP